MENNAFPVAVDSMFGFIPAEELNGISLAPAGAIRFDDENWNLFVGEAPVDVQKISVLLDHCETFPVRDYAIEPVIMSGELEMVIPGFDKDRDSFLLGGYSFLCDGNVIPVDFSGMAWSIDQKGDQVSLSFSSGRTFFSTNYFLDDCYEDSYSEAGLKINNITAEFLSKSSAITEFMVSLELNNQEYLTEDIAEVGRFTIKSLSFENDMYEYPIKQEVLDAFNASLDYNRIPDKDQSLIQLDARLGISLQVFPEELEVLKRGDETAKNLLIRLVQSDRCTICGDTYFPEFWNEDYLSEDLGFDLPSIQLFSAEQRKDSLSAQIESASHRTIEPRPNPGGHTRDPER